MFLQGVQESVRRRRMVCCSLIVFLTHVFQLNGKAVHDVLHSEK